MARIAAYNGGDVWIAPPKTDTYPYQPIKGEGGRKVCYNTRMTQRTRQTRRGVGRNYWMFVESPENFDAIKKMGVTLFGMGLRYRRRAERMAPGDRVIFYVRGVRKWTACATITSEYFEDDSPVFHDHDPEERFPLRVSMAPDIVLDESDYIDATMLAYRLDYVRRWAPEEWPLAFLDRLHLLPQKDFRLIEGEMRRAVSRRR